MKVKNLTIALLIINCIGINKGFAGKSQAEGDEDKEVTASITATTNYIWRGFSQTKNKPALQGDFTLTIPKSPIKGLYFNLWFSNARFLPDEPLEEEPEENKDSEESSTTEDSGASGDMSESAMPPEPPKSTKKLTFIREDGSHRAFMELDTSIGIYNEINKNASYDIWFSRYNYPGPTNLNYNELGGEFKFHFLTSLIGLTDNVYNSGGKALYYNFGFDFALPESFKLKQVRLKGGIGHYFLPLISGVNSYTDYNLEIDKTYKKFAFSLFWTKTNNHITPFGGSRVTFAVSAFI